MGSSDRRRKRDGRVKNGNENTTRDWNTDDINARPD